ncbi:hypothetical protein F5051DRAFT_441293 [Lentinula edodes]|nr:hypothetical protein F5051DRAFT_441293 [Lentinula edodes]
MCTFKDVSHLFTLLLLIFMLQTGHAAPAPMSTQQTNLQQLHPPGGKRNADWILDFYGDNIYLNEDDKKAFMKNLDHLVVGDIRSDCPGDFSKGIYTLLKDYEVGGINYDKDKVLIKVIGGVENSKSKVDYRAWGEVKALKDVGLYIDSGMANVDHGNYPVIVMKMVEGVRIQDTIEYKDANPDQKLKLLEEAKPHIRKEVVDSHLGNFLVGGTRTSKGLVLETPITKVQLVDWGYPGVFKVKKGVTKAEVEEWFDLDW